MKAMLEKNMANMTKNLPLMAKYKEHDAFKKKEKLYPIILEGQKEQP